MDGKWPEDVLALRPEVRICMSWSTSSALNELIFGEETAVMVPELGEETGKTNCSFVDDCWRRCYLGVRTQHKLPDKKWSSAPGCASHRAP